MEEMLQLSTWDISCININFVYENLSGRGCLYQMINLEDHMELATLREVVEENFNFVGIHDDLFV